MDISVNSDHPNKTTADCIVIGIFETQKLTPAAELVDIMTDKFLSKSILSGNSIGTLANTMMVSLPNLRSGQHILLVGCGKQKEFDPSALNKVIAATARTLRAAGVKQAAIYLTELSVEKRDLLWVFKHSAQSLENTLYQFDQLKSKADRKTLALRKVSLYVRDSADLKKARLGLRQGKATAKGVRLAKDLGNLPGNICTPTYLANQARKLHKSYGIKVTIHNQKQMEKLGMNALLSVARGSREAPKLITMEYSGSSGKSAPIVLVGKGLTFDAGGISLKPAASMDEMKYDMCGAASVFGAMVAAAEMRLPIHLIGIVPSSENLPDGAANKPGDIVKSMSGQTIEILNTDAEGRLILCDALTYAERFKPAAIV
ncbi:leucyl aminopeptidase, partial [Pseudomonadota bacterium]